MKNDRKRRHALLSGLILLAGGLIGAGLGARESILFIVGIILALSGVIKLYHELYCRRGWYEGDYCTWVSLGKNIKWQDVRKVKRVFPDEGTLMTHRRAANGVGFMSRGVKTPMIELRRLTPKEMEDNDCR